MLIVFGVALFCVFIFVDHTKAATDPVVVADGDIVCGVASAGAACKQMETSNLAIGLNPTAVLVLGDNQYEDGAYYDFQKYYEPSWGRLKAITYPVVGNHEYLTPKAQGYFDYFNGIGNQTGIAGDRAKGYYAFNIGSWRLYALNSNCSEAGGCQAGSPQEKWLRSDLAANPHQCVLAYYHHPLYTSGSRDLPAAKPLYQALYDYSADVVLAGHEHNYERFARMDANGNLNSKGVREFVVGTGGRNFTQFVRNAPGSEVRNDNTFGVLKLTLHQSSYDAEFIPIPGSAFSDKLLNEPCSGSGVNPTPTPSSTPTPSGLIYKTGDVNHDGRVDIIDIGIEIDNYGKIPVVNQSADINKDGVVNIIDIGIIIDNYGR